ncbi:hypothetical protein EAb13_CDS0124 [Acinetobacter phage EAb13]|nr:hypothetical protein EAb13_CDS0006 [Acinetobacter phage EAb13]WGH24542.1 hypothetical protein EAb13_CDS0124 [Acinetobacter phage EAb13]
MTHKIFDKLPDCDLPQYRTYTSPDFNMNAYIAKVFDNSRAYREAFNLPYDMKGSLEKIAIGNVRVIDLLRMNTRPFLDAKFLKEKAREFKAQLDEAWTDLANNEAYSFYYINRDSALTHDIYFILNTILEY